MDPRQAAEVSAYVATRSLVAEMYPAAPVPCQDVPLAWLAALASVVRSRSISP